jgi:hypothetical protein
MSEHVSKPSSFRDSPHSNRAIGFHEWIGNNGATRRARGDKKFHEWEGRRDERLINGIEKWVKKKNKVGERDGKVFYQWTDGGAKSASRIITIIECLKKR